MFQKLLKLILTKMQASRLVKSYSLVEPVKLIVWFLLAVTIHWHGVVQKDSSLMDGVAFVNQCPIQPGLSFTYK